MDFVIVGKITTTHGLKGEVKVVSNDDYLDLDFDDFLFIDDGSFRKIEIDKIRYQGRNFIIKFKELDSINDVEPFCGKNLLADKKVIEDQGKLIIEDLIGLKVFNQDNVFRGIVNNVINYPQCYYLEIINDNKKSLVPFIGEFVVSIDDKIIINEIEGLLNDY